MILQSTNKLYIKYANLECNFIRHEHTQEGKQHSVDLKQGVRMKNALNTKNH